jgi:hypothetical protein
MKTSKALSAAFLMASAILAAPAALAEQPRNVQAAFAFNPNDPAAEIYADLVRTARKACEFHGVRMLKLMEHEKACVKAMLNDGVAKLGRPDVAAIHGGSLPTAEAAARG